MGPVFGKTEINEPKYKVLKSSEKFEIRLNTSYIVAEIDCGENHDEDVAALARYIGVSGLPKNKQEKSDVQFILPERFTSVEQVPVPKNKRILIKKIPERPVAVVKFAGVATEARCLKNLRRLYDMLLEEKLYTPENPKQVGSPPLATSTAAEAPAEAPADAPAQAPAVKGPALFDPSLLPWSVAEYHPYVTLPALRRNEVWIDLKSDNPALQLLVAQYQQQHPDDAPATQVAGEKISAEKDTGAEDAGVAAEKDTGSEDAGVAAESV